MLLAACTNWDDPQTVRAQRADSATGDIVIGAVWPWSSARGNLWQGIELAVDEINASGGLLNRKLRIDKQDDESSLAKGLVIAQQFADNLDMVAVIGHYNSYIALPAAATYQSAGLVYLTPGATSYQINNLGHNMVFRSVPSNRSLGNRIAENMAAKGLRRVAIFYKKEKSSQDIANYFEQRGRELGLTIVDRRSFMQGSQDFSNAIQNWKDLYQFDAVFLAANVPEAAYFISQMRKMGLSVPIFGDHGLDTRQLFEIAGSAAEGVFVTDSTIQEDNWPAYQHFNKIFTQKYHQAAGASAAKGYDAVNLLAQAIRQANSTVPAKIAQALHSTSKWPGASGEFTFDEKGDIPDKKIGMKVVHGDKFEMTQ
jgi:branched-chain amino acid transport system substrate-binding protein